MAGVSRMTHRTRWIIACLGFGALAVGTALLLRPSARAPEPGGGPGAAGLYAEHCAVCHGASGRGDGPGARVVGHPIRDFTDAGAMRQVSDRFLFDIIRKGGSQFGRSNAMPAWGMKLSDAEIEELVAYIRSLANKQQSAVSDQLNAKR
jgi:mono/diheme cytochrome c family protein